MNYSARERFAQLMQQQGQAVSPQGSQSGQMLSAVRMAEGGQVGALPTLQELTARSTAPFTQSNPTVPMFNLQSPAFGGMEQSTYDFTAPRVEAGRLYQPTRQEPATTERSSAYRPVDATTVMDSQGNIPNVPIRPGDVLPSTEGSSFTGATTTGSMPTVVTAEDRANQQAQAEQAAQARQAEEARLEQHRQEGIMSELGRREEARRAAEQAAAAEEARRLEIAEQARLARERAAEKARADAAAKARADAAAKAKADADAKAKADAAAKAQTTAPEKPKSAGETYIELMTQRFKDDPGSFFPTNQGE